MGTTTPSPSRHRRLRAAMTPTRSEGPMLLARTDLGTPESRRQPGETRR